jgi:hypothetical protein
VEGAVKGRVTEQVRFTFLSFRCTKESDHDQLSSSDEPYFIIAMDQFDGDPAVEIFSFENIVTNPEVGVGAGLLQGVPPNPTAIRVIAYERDEGDPEETAAELQETLVELSNEVSKIASASGADAASGPGVGFGAAASTVAGIVAGPIGAAVAAGVVSVLDLRDGFIGQDVKMVFNRPEETETPRVLDKFRGNPFNAKIELNNVTEGSYEFFFDVHKTTTVRVTS